MRDVPAYSEGAIDVLDLFYQDYVAAIFYFEDSEHESFYERILSRLIPNVRSFQVLCLGGKTKVISKSKEPAEGSARRIFVLDKDFDDLLGTVYRGPGVYYLRSFSIENYMIDLLALLKMAVELDARRLTVASALQRCAGFPQYLSRLNARLLDIARIFVVARRYRVSVETTKMSVESLLKDGGEDELIPTDGWVERYVRALVDSTLGDNEWLHDEDAFRAALLDAFVRPPELEFPEVSEYAHICGKHLWGCVVRYVQRALDVKLLDLDGVELYLRVATHINLNKLNYLRESILADYPDLVSA